VAHAVVMPPGLLANVVAGYGRRPRYLCEVSGEPGSVRYRLQSGTMRWAWAWEFCEWRERHEAFPEPPPEATAQAKMAKALK
jgi:hypothetical protein